MCTIPNLLTRLDLQEHAVESHNHASFHLHHAANPRFLLWAALPTMWHYCTSASALTLVNANWDCLCSHSLKLTLISRPQNLWFGW